MKFKLLLLPVLVALLSACNDDKETITPEKPVTTVDSNGPLLDPSSKGNIAEFGGATRLKAERTEAMKASLSNRQVKHVILFIGDGTSESEITAARNYVEGASGYFKGLDVLPFTGAYTTYSLDKETKKIDYVTDSAASASAWSTGTKTYNGALGIDASDNKKTSILKIAKAAGFATGNVTTTELQDATPAAQVAQINNRGCYGPVKTSTNCSAFSLEKNGPGSITEQLLTTKADVTLGGGKKTFAETVTGGAYKGMTLLDQAKKMGYQVVENIDELKAVQSADQSKPLLGLFASGNLPVIWSGPAAVADGNKQASSQCIANAEFKSGTPKLKDMTAKAIELLQVNKKGFFLQVESGSIDKQNHAADACGQIGETVQLDDAIQVALEFAKKNPDTLIIVTGDHAHTSQIIPNNSDSPGKTVKLLTKDGADMTINYATTKDGSQQHTGAQVRTAAYGPHAGNVSGLLDQTDLYFIMRNALGIK
ncbi:alkaline phosphatase [Acinetobacter rudis]|uniref:Alkaline phosphatase n=1 Tax=Acinetobacter rudis CIP 110305 TaxID=421052 RepID=S3PM13_9GAMM|nr:alkaline phosphatase [Acinetobacter rudis]EPF79851.1 alkaline phosphatase [Acinetobacter rudis CIP 110305]